MGVLGEFNRPLHRGTHPWLSALQGWRGLMDTNPSVPPTQMLTAESATPQEVVQQQITTQDYVVLRMAVMGLILAVVLSLGFVAALAWLEKPLPDGVLAMGSASVGALATMLVRPPLSYPNGNKR